MVAIEVYGGGDVVGMDGRVLVGGKVGEGKKGNKVVISLCSCCGASSFALLVIGEADGI